MEREMKKHYDYCKNFGLRSCPHRDDPNLIVIKDWHDIQVSLGKEIELAAKLCEMCDVFEPIGPIQ
jgi:hypothetical protein